ncbi:hypothetical protein IE81DRAFT_349660 [Ceraceosorus guamensis]|uniref:Uncharacterized protein n=1 Tax=Ceraceosorus guamensis TaxID=1522189 RepID=A0A316VUR5_9BASI|nr:hypothetical protein IE81DRAFT_349660 [Ceraceosorus guamensis]PWN40011.1 hypothetical protein IE81DRAFT_349660 [Ceraceosorus guamensis]
MENLSEESIARLEAATQANKGLLQLKGDFIVHKSTVSNDQISLEDRIQVLESEKKDLMTQNQVKKLIKTPLAQHKADAQTALAQHKADAQIKRQELEKKVEVLASENKHLKLIARWSKYFLLAVVAVALVVTLWHFAGDGFTEWTRHPNKVPEWLVDYLELQPTVTMEIHHPLHWLDKVKLSASNLIKNPFSPPPLKDLPLPPTPIKFTDVLGLDLRTKRLDLRINETDFLAEHPDQSLSGNWKGTGLQEIIVLLSAPAACNL